MIDRYTRPQMASIWSDQTKYTNWLKIELLAVAARAQQGEVPAEDLAVLKERAAFDVDRINELEEKTRHDVAAFIDNVAESVGEAARHLHYGMTSSDVLDTALSMQLVESSDLLDKGLALLIDICAGTAREHARSVMAGRTHGIHAEPTTFGLKAAGWALELDRGRTRLAAAQKEIAIGKLSGTVGTYSQLPPQIERYVCEQLGLAPDPLSTQVISRDRHANFAAILAVIAGTVERVAVEIRHLARTEVAEAQEPFATGEQKGSSAMPHKRNPWRCERLTGLARLVRASVGPAMEDIALWHERDISHSSVERVILPDMCILVDFMLAEAADLVGNLVIDPARMRENMDMSFGALFSQNVLLALVDSGLSRDAAYRIVQEACAKAAGEQIHLRQVLAADSEVAGRLSAEQIEKCFDEQRYLEHTDEILSRLDKAGR